MSKAVKAVETKQEVPVVEPEGKFGPTIALNPSDKFVFRFGPAKAKLIVEHIEAIKKFADDFGKN